MGSIGKDKILRDDAYFHWTLGRLMRKLHQYDRWVHDPKVIEETPGDTLDWYRRNLDQLYRALDHVHAQLLNRYDLSARLRELGNVLGR